MSQKKVTSRQKQRPKIGFSKSKNLNLQGKAFSWHKVGGKVKFV